MRKLRIGIPTSIVVLALVGLVLNLGGCAQDASVDPQLKPATKPTGGPSSVSGGGEAVAVDFVEYSKVGGTTKVPSIGTIGNRITFGFNAKKKSNGKVQGQMQMVDHDRGMVIHSDVVELSVPHPVHIAPIGLTGLSASMKSSTQSVKVNGEPRPGWKFVNSPLFDGGEGANGDGDTICFELFNQDGVKLLQWSAFLSSGNVQVVQ